MKNLLLIFTCCFFFSNQLSAQIFMKKGDLRVGIKVIKDDKVISIDNLCKAYHPITNVPIDFKVPEGSSVEFITDSIKAEDFVLMLNNREPNYINQPIRENNRFGTSTGAGSTNSYAFIDKIKKDTLTIKWAVDYDLPKLLDLYPAEYFDDYISHTFKNIFEQYPDTIRYNWSEVDYIQKLDEYGLPISPTFPYNHKGLFFVIYISENAVVKMKGFHNKFHKVDIDNPLDLFLYEDLKPGTYEFITKPYADAPESLWLKYPFTIEKPWWQQGNFQAISGGIIFILLTTIILTSILIRQKRREKELRWKQKITNAELKAIRAQLNPHFLFNALNSIQNLVVQQKNEQANLYITKLSRLLRQVLSSSEKQFQELEDELQLNRSYLEIEQLRFSFSFQINVSKSVNIHTLVPVMLLQPYIENAVKHGIHGNDEGVIIINIKREGKNLNIEILDNGPGLSLSNGNSKGLVLGDNWIHHLNNVYSNEASLEVKNRETTNGVIVKINLPIE